MGNLLLVSQQVLILFILICVGFICSKVKFFTPEIVSGLSKFVLYFVTPCVIINSFNREFERTMLFKLFLSFIAAIGVHIINIIAAQSIVHDKDKSREKVLRFGTVFSNCGYMALPLQEAFLGSEGVFYGAAFIGVFNLINWTYGYALMKDSQDKMPISKIFLNPGVIGVLTGLLIFFLPISIPSIIITPIKSLAALNTPLPMVIIGVYLSRISDLAFLKDVKLCLVIFLRLVICPVIALFIMYFLGIRNNILLVVIIAASTPTAANTVMFSSIFNRDTELASELVSVSTLISIITMPLIISLAMNLMQI